MTLRIEGVGRVFPAVRGGTPVRALSPVSLAVGAGEFIAILGPSGCGKSTLLRIVAGLDTPTEGRVLRDGQVVTGPGADRGMVFQSYTLFPWLTVQQNIAYGLAERGVPAARSRDIVAHYIARMGLGGFENHWPKQLSGGMQQRVAIARALAAEPRVLLLDEPFSAVDALTRLELQALVLDLWTRNRFTAVLVTHDVEEAVFMADRVAILSQRPTTITDTIEVGLPRPRDPIETRERPRFLELRHRLTSMLLGREAPAHA